MKVKKLLISNYKNLKNIDLDFQSDLVTLLVGKNGLGKSNLIEILGLIFRDLDLLKSLEQFENWAYNPDYFEYTIQYVCFRDELRVVLKKGKFEIYIRPKGSDEDYPFVDLSFDDFQKYKKVKYLPKYILGYYSGENKRIKAILEPHEKIQAESLKNWNRSKSKSEELSFRKIFFTENRHSSIILLTLSLYQNHRNFKSKITDLLKNYLAIDSLEDFTITFNNPDWSYSKIDGKNKGADYVFANITDKEPVENPFWNLKGKVDILLNKLFEYLMGEGRQPIAYPNKGEDPQKRIKEFLQFNNISILDFSEEILEDFPHPIDFFDALETCHLFGVLYRIDFKVKKKNVDKPIQFSELSEGEQQLLTVLGLILVTGKDDCLYLLDEPDTHLNPAWQRSYADLLDQFNLNDDNSHIFVATHSPLIVQSSNKSDVILFSTESDQITVEESQIEFETWRIDHVLTSKYFGFESARPNNKRIDDFYALRKKFLDKKITDAEIEKLKTTLEGHLFPSGETYNDLVMLEKIKSNQDGPDQ